MTDLEQKIDSLDLDYWKALLATLEEDCEAFGVTPEDNSRMDELRSKIEKLEPTP